MKIKLLSLLILVGVSFSCINEFELTGLTYDKLLVVDGILTDELKQHHVRLTYTSPINSDDENSSPPVSGAQVSILDSDGNIYSYIETSNGNYVSEIAFRAMPGKSYTLQISTIDGNEYISTETELISSPSIGSIYPELTFKLLTDLNRTAPGVQFYIDSKPENEEQIYFRYEWSETFKVITPFKSQFDYNPQTGDYFLRENKIDVCYQTNYSDEIILGNTNSNANNQLTEVPVNFVALGPNRNTSDYLRNRYSIEVTQYAISADDYNYYQRIKKLDEDTGTLFDQQLGSVRGNIKSLSDEEELVLGNFEVAGVSRKRAFFDPEDYGENFEVPDFRYFCGIDEIMTVSNDSLSYYMDQGFYRIISVVSIPINDEEIRLSSRGCSDCTWYADSEKPEFWIDEAE
ncbi:DUF4249 domain-containing protein [Marivirga sp.]|uniref:DUF4249 domain-containing protein n=1 Tax=Marivirga sp. TaxID=2018662 RepID=UPI002D8026E3|nr:DUF4249 domain-containing protein [Marivirga sp.]HET8859989.1 DUF4249 domain-containing protein [Marivirga sp.]